MRKPAPEPYWNTDVARHAGVLRAVPEGYDFICSVTTVHHMDFGAALTRMRELLRPGGTSVVVGLARDAGVADRTARIAAAPVVRITKVLRGARDPEGMPVAEPRMS